MSWLKELLGYDPYRYTSYKIYTTKPEEYYFWLGAEAYDFEGQPYAVVYEHE